MPEMMNEPAMNEPVITILGSGVALGVYLPALVLEHQLRRAELSTEVVLLEDLYPPEGLETLEKLRAVFRERFALAKIGQRMTHSTRPRLDPRRTEALLQAWEHQDRRFFIVWSGFWMPLLDEYRARRAPRNIHADLCRIDATPSASFKGYETLTAEDREIRFWNGSEKRLEYELSIPPTEPIPYARREDLVVVHGGGWGLGEYREVVTELEQRGTRLGKVVYRWDEVDDAHRCFMIDPSWRPWRRSGRPEFPPLGEVTTQGGRFENREDRHELYEIIRRSRAIVSKPGGGTLMDSLSSSTPVLFLEPYGEAERSNAELWQHLGFGISYADWKAPAATTRRSFDSPRISTGESATRSTIPALMRSTCARAATAGNRADDAGDGIPQVGRFSAHGRLQSALPDMLRVGRCRLVSRTQARAPRC